MRVVLALSAAALFVLSAPATAQRPAATSASPSPEFGIDAGASFGLGSNSVTTVSIPVQQLRVGFFMSPELSLEPSLGLSSISGGGSTLTAYDLGVGLLYHFAASRSANQFYVRPFVDVVGISGGGASNSSTVVGFGGGVKVPLRDRIATRFEANIAHSDGNDAVGLLAGLSFYTH